MHWPRNGSGRVGRSQEQMMIILSLSLQRTTSFGVPGKVLSENSCRERNLHICLCLNKSLSMILDLEADVFLVVRLEEVLSG